MKAYSLIDITETRQHKSTSNDPIAIKQQANFMSFIQTITLRQNFYYDTAPTVVEMTASKIKDLGFGTDYKGKHKVWCFTFRADDHFEESPPEIIESDLDLIPMIPDLTETIQINNNVFRTSDSTSKNIVIQATNQTVEGDE